MAFTIDLTENESYAKPVDAVDRHFVMHRRVDFTETDNQLANAQTMGLFQVPPYVLVEEVIMVVRTADADVTDVDIGRYSTAGVVAAVDAFIDGGTLATTGEKRDLAGETYSKQDGTAGYMGAAAWTIGLINNDADTINEAIVDFFAICVDLRNTDVDD